jgi:predicted nucleic acid-binding protein
MTRYLLDVNALIALGFREHEFHAPVATWVRKLNSGDELVTCAITELGFVRVLVQLAQAELSVDETKNILQRLKSVGVQFTFVADDHDASRLPGWAKTPKANDRRTLGGTCEGAWCEVSDTGSKHTWRISDPAEALVVKKVPTGQIGWGACF